MIFSSLIILADGRMDSPGFNANFCTYVLMNNAGLGILDVVIIDKRKVGLKSTNVEKEGFVSGLKSLQKDGFTWSRSQQMHILKLQS